MKEHRESGRIPLRAHAHINSHSRDLPAHLLNVSRSGVLIAITDKHNLQPGEHVALCIELNEREKMDFEGTVAHVKDHFVGLECRSSEACSLSLNRLLERLESEGDLDIEY